MKMIKKTVACALAVGLITGMFSGCNGELSSGMVMTRMAVNATGSATGSGNPPLSQRVKGVTIRTQNNQNFPSAPNLGSGALNGEIEQLVSHIKSIGGNTVMLQLRSEGEALYSSKVFPRSQFWVEEQGDFSFYDPFKQFITQAKKENMQVFGMISPFYLGESTEKLASSSPLLTNGNDCINIGGKYYFSPDSDFGVTANLEDISRLVEKYSPTGIILSDLDDHNLMAQPAYLEKALSLIKGLKEKFGDNLLLGATISSPYITDEQLTALSNELDVVIPLVEGSTNYQKNDFAKQLSYFQGIVGKEKCLPMLSNSSGNNEMVFQSYLLNEQEIGLMYGDYNALSAQTAVAKIASVGSTLATFDSTLNYTPEPVLKVTHPKENYKTNTSSFYITGTSNPALPLTVNGQTVERYTDNGMFGILLDLAMGNNTFVFRQGENQVSYTIQRFVPSDVPATTDKITKTYPDAFGVAFVGEETSISCVAPGGSSVTATINGKNYPLKQVAATSPSIPATFRATMMLEEQASTLKNLGKITYTLVHNGKTTTYTSKGDLYVAPKGVKLYGEVTADTQSVYGNSDLTGDYLGIYREGTIEELVEFGSSYVKTRSEGYLPISTISLLESSAVTPVSITEAKLITTDDSVSFLLKGGASAPYSLKDEGNGVYVFTLYSPGAIEELALPYTDLFTDVSANYSNESAYEIRFTAKNSTAIWGYDVFYTGDDAEVFFKLAPKKSDDPLKPLKNLTVVLDPGHGGKDIGAPSALRTIGPHESAFAFSTTAAIKAQLETLGATVTMTRNGDDTMSLSERAKATRAQQPHISLSVHYNSHAETTDGNKVSGIETYYHYQNAKELSDLLGQSMTENTGRRLRWSNSGNYIVTKYPFTTALLLETGYMPNPLEYTQTMSRLEMIKVGVSVADAFATAIERYGRS